ncbi:hypothetical protein BB560_000676 [Smittium megazygosporum]|uniref:WD repeat-containing protein 75 second beta-propeller domain-containing protein n=1 Tax=Smittium megazygosporum TaxID=133381 RepID=A0A2T9ZJS5_9FUNG|nr:hypothetical protein BB560_000676 [Smittium megazygosporum]
MAKRKNSTITPADSNLSQGPNSVASNEKNNRKQSFSSPNSPASENPQNISKNSEAENSDLDGLTTDNISSSERASELSDHTLNEYPKPQPLPSISKTAAKDINPNGNLNPILSTNIAQDSQDKFNAILLNKCQNVKDNYTKLQKLLLERYFEGGKGFSDLKPLYQYDLGGKNREEPVLFSDNQKYFYVCTRNSIKMYGTQNGELVGKIENPLRSPTTLVSAVLTKNPESQGAENVIKIRTSKYNDELLCLFYRDKSVDIYDAKLLTILKTIFLAHSPTCVTKSIINGEVFYSSTEKSYSKKSKNIVNKFIVYKSNIFAESPDSANNTLALLKLKGVCLQLEQTPNGKHLAILTKRNVYTINTQQHSRINSFELNSELTMFAINPKNHSQIAVGDISGKIHLCHQVFDQNSNVVKTVMHWHSNRVNSLAYTSDGNYILSGGNEAVLVFWQLSTFQRDFLPRLGANIVGVSLTPDSMIAGVTLNNNSVIVIDFNSKKLISMISGLQTSKGTPSLAIYPDKPWLTVTGSSGMLQTFDLINDRHISNLEIVNYNHINTNLSSTVPKIDLYKYSSNGKWLATIDTNTSKIAAFPTLKFLAFDNSQQRFVLNTKVKLPHLNNPVNDIAINSTGNSNLYAVCATCDNNIIKLWEYDKNDISSNWKRSCHPLTLFESKDEKIVSICFSSDGSILMARTSKKLIYLIDATQMKVVAGPILISKSGKKSIDCMFLGANSEYIIDFTNDSITVFDSITLKILFYFQVPENWELLLACASQSLQTTRSKFAVLLKNKSIPQNEITYNMVFEISNGMVKFESIVEVSSGSSPLQIIGFKFISLDGPDDSFVLLDNSSNFKILSTLDLSAILNSSNYQNPASNKNTGQSSDNDIDQKLFDSIYSKSLNSQQKKITGENTLSLNRAAANLATINQDSAFMFVPSHQMPNVKTLFEASCMLDYENNMANPDNNVANKPKNQNRKSKTKKSDGFGESKNTESDSASIKPNLDQDMYSTESTADVNNLSNSNVESLEILSNVFSTSLSN